MLSARFYVRALMPKTDFQDYLCRPFCSFFRAGEKEDLACQGAQVLDALVKSGRLCPEQFPGAGAKQSRLWQECDPELEAALCSVCPFRLDGCDFHSALRNSRTEPCGGYLLLKLLQERGVISCADLKSASGGAMHVA